MRYNCQCFFKLFAAVKRKPPRSLATTGFGSMTIPSSKILPPKYTTRNFLIALSIWLIIGGDSAQRIGTIASFCEQITRFTRVFSPFEHPFIAFRLYRTKKEADPKVDKSTLCDSLFCTRLTSFRHALEALISLCGGVPAHQRSLYSLFYRLSERARRNAHNPFKGPAKRM